MPEPLSMKTSFEMADNQLRITYTVANAGTHTAYLLNRLFDLVPELKLNPDRVLIDLLPGPVILFSKRIPDMPQGRTILSPYCPYVTAVPPGKPFDETVVIPLPLQIWWPPGYELLPHREKPVLRRFPQVALRLDFYWAVDGVIEKPATIGKDPVILPTFPPGKRPQFGTLTSPPCRAEIPVLDPRP